jgi:hypothetical protein
MTDDRERFHLVLPLAPGVVAALEFPRPMTPDEWAQMMRILEVLRRGIVAAGPEARP